MLFISTSTPMVCFFISSICLATFSFIIKSSISFCVFSLLVVHIFALKADNSKSIPRHILYNLQRKNCVFLQLLTNASNNLFLWKLHFHLHLSPAPPTFFRIPDITPAALVSVPVL